MTQRLKSTLKASAAILFAFALVFMNVMPAFADDEVNSPGTAQGGTAASPAKAAVTKQLRVPEGTDVPYGTEVTFTATQYTFNGDDDTDKWPSDLSFPALTIPNIEYLSTDIVGEDVFVDTSAGITTLTKESETITNPAFTKVGRYSYKITETTFTYPISADFDVTSYESLAEYILEFHVEKDSADNYFVRFITAKYTKTDTGDDAGEVKVDPTPGEFSEEYDYSQVIFINDYVKTNGGTDPEDPDDSTLYIDKTVVGNAADEDLYFPFEVTIYNPTGLNVTLPESYAAFIVGVDSGGDPEIKDQDGASPATSADGVYSIGYFFTFKVGETRTLYFKHGEYLAFLDTPVGATWTVVERLSDVTGGSDYTPYVDITIAGGTPIASSGLQGADLGTDAPRLIGEAADNGISNSAKFKNTYGFTPPTGIIISNLPYIGLILLALASLAAYVALKARQRRRAEVAYLD
jgi:hypothetical protein